MATTTSKPRCVTCERESTTIYKCEGCSQHFCIYHLAEHYQVIRKQWDEVKDRRDLFREILTEQKNNPQKHSLIEQIDKWECDSINKIQQTAEEARKLVVQYAGEYINRIEMKLTKLTEQLKETPQENDINEIHLNQLKETLTKLEEALTNPSNITIQEDSSSFISKISVVISSASLCVPNVAVYAKWIQNGTTVAGGNGYGNGLNQLSLPWCVCVYDDQTIYVADYSNHRIVEWKMGATSGKVVAGGTGAGNRNDQLNTPTSVFINKKGDYFIICDYGNKRVMRWPRRNGTSGEIIISNVDCWNVSIDDDEYIYVSDISKHEVRRWKIGDTNGTLVAGGNGSGSRLDQLNAPYYIFVDQDHSVYVSDYNNHRVMKWVKDAKEGIVVAGGQGYGRSLKQLSNPRGVIVDQLGTVYVVDHSNYRIMCWLKGASQGSVVVGGNGCGQEANQFNGLLGLSFDRENNLYVVDYSNYRIQKFDIE